MYIASMTPFSSAVSSGRNARSCLWSRRSHSSDGFSISGPIISGLSYQSSGYGNSTIWTSLRVMPFSRSISSMPCSSWMPHQSVLIVFWLLERPIFLPFRSAIR